MVLKRLSQICSFRVPLLEATLICVTCTLTTFSVSLHDETEPRDEGIRRHGMEMTKERMTGSKTRVHYLQYGLCGNNRCFKCQWSDARVHLMHLTSNH